MQHREIFEEIFETESLQKPLQCHHTHTQGGSSPRFSRRWCSYRANNVSKDTEGTSRKECHPLLEAESELFAHSGGAGDDELLKEKSELHTKLGILIRPSKSAEKPTSAPSSNLDWMV